MAAGGSYEWRKWLAEVGVDWERAKRGGWAEAGVVAGAGTGARAGWERCRRRSCSYEKQEGLSV